jgi:hypothetical protein
MRHGNAPEDTDEEDNVDFFDMESYSIKANRSIQRQMHGEMQSILVIGQSLETSRGLIEAQMHSLGSSAGNLDPWNVMVICFKNFQKDIGDGQHQGGLTTLQLTP